MTKKSFLVILKKHISDCAIFLHKYAEKVFFVKCSIPYLSVLYHICIYLDLHECLYVPRPAAMLFSVVVCSAQNNRHFDVGCLHV